MARYGREHGERRGSRAYGRGYDMDMGGSRWAGARRDWGGARDYGTGGRGREYGNPGWQGQSFGNPDWGGPRRFGAGYGGRMETPRRRGYDADLGDTLRRGWNDLTRGVRRAWDRR